MKLLTSVSLLLLGLAAVTNCQPHYLIQAFEDALRNDSSNLVKLQNIFYPPRSSPANTAVVTIEGGIIVNNIRKNSSESVEQCTNLDLHDYDNCTRAAFVYDSGTYRLDIESDIDINFLLTDDVNANSYSKLLSYISSGSIVPLLAMFDYVSLNLLNTLTFTPLLSTSISPDKFPYSSHDINLDINDLDVMPSYADAVDALMSVLSWVCMYVCTTNS